MSRLFAIIIIIALVASSISQKKKKAAAQNRAAAARKAPFPPEPAKPKPAPVFREGEGYSDDGGCIGGSLPHTGHSGTSYTDEAGCIGGSIPHTDHAGVSASDDMGCVGGSLPHESHEGGNAVTRSSDWQEAKIVTSNRTKITAADMRRAVVMNEILQPPVSMRGR